MASKQPKTPPTGPPAEDITVDLLVVGSGTGLAAALTGHDLGLRTLVIEKTPYVGGSTARSGGAFWIPGNPILARGESPDSVERAAVYLEALVGDVVPAARWQNFLANGADTVALLERMTPTSYFWTEGYSDYHPEQPGGSAIGRTCESRPFDASMLGDERGRLRPGVLEAPVPMPVTGADYRLMNLMTRKPLKAFGRIGKRVFQGIGGMALGREYMAGGQALAAGLFAGTIASGIPIWTNTELLSLIVEDGRVVGVTARQADRTVTIRAERGVVLAAGGFDHNMAMRHEHQSTMLDNISLGAEGNTGDSIAIGGAAGAATDLMGESWWFPAFASVDGGQPGIMLAERSMPGSLIVDQGAERFVNESTDYMSFGQRILEREHAGTPVTTMWFVFDQTYKNRCVIAGAIFPRAPIPAAWYEAGVAHRGDSARELAASIGLPADTLEQTISRFNDLAGNGIDDDFGRGASRYDQYYGDPTNLPNPNLRPLTGSLYAIKMVLSDLGTCGGMVADEHARVLRPDHTVIPGLYAIGNNAANAFGRRYPGAGATIGQGLVYGYIAAHDAAAS